MDNFRADAFLPLIYLAWSDDLLTQNEVETLKSFIGSQDWLNEEEHTSILNKLDVLKPPSRVELMEWLSRIQKSQSSTVASNLFELSLIMSGNVPEVRERRDEWLQLEQDLGSSGQEAFITFKNAQDASSSQQSAGSFNVAALTQLLDGDQVYIINRVKEVISRPEFTYTSTTDINIYREQVFDWCKQLAIEGFGSMAYPKTYGGGENLAAYFAIMETLSYHDLSLVIKFGVQFGLWGMSVQLLGTEKHHQKYLADIGSLKLPGCFAMTETHHGSNVKGLETTATYDHINKTFIVHTPHPAAQKEYIGNAAVHGQMATVFAQLIIDGKGYGINTFIVPLRDADGTILPGITIGDCGHKMGLNGVDNGTLRFDRVVIPKENMLDRFASVNSDGEFESPIPSDNRRFFTMLGTLVGGRIGIPRSALSAMKSGLAITIKYSDQRRQFGPEGGSEIPILNYRMHQRRLMPWLATTYALHFALRYITQRYLDKKENEAQEIEALAAGMKAYTTWCTRDALQECREACGGKGYLSENRIDALKNDTEIYTTFEGDNTVLMQLVAKNRLSIFRKSFGKMGVKDVMGYMYEQAKTAISEKNPVITRRTDDDHLLDAAFHLQALEHREQTILASATKRLKKLVDGGRDAYDAFNVAQHQMMDVADAYLERVILTQFQLAVNSIQDKPTFYALTKLAQLYALSAIENNKAWYLEDGYLEPVKTKAIRKMVNQLCWDVRKDAVALVAAFAIPDACLAAPIAFSA